MQQPVFTHQFGNKLFAEAIRNLYAEDFMKIALSHEDLTPNTN